jgi:ABC-type bacteriocin/lantibiotic exporter with double-glycine peptidase domain
MKKIFLILSIIDVIAVSFAVFCAIYLGGIILIAIVCTIITAIIVYIILFEKPKEFEKYFINSESHKAKFLNEEFSKLSKEDQAKAESLLNDNITDAILHAMDRHTTDYCRRLK